MITPLNPETLKQGVEFLCATDPDLARIFHPLGIPPLWPRQPGFPTLIHIVLEQQVSLASARAAMNKLLAEIPDLTPQAFLALGDAPLKTIGFSHQKAAYCRGLAGAILDGKLNLEHLAALDDLTARNMLMQIKGIGPWTADIYLLMALLRPDVWPVGDLALAVALQEVKGLAARPGRDEFMRIAAPWRPWRAVAARLLWHHYLRPR